MLKTLIHTSKLLLLLLLAISQLFSFAQEQTETLADKHKKHLEYLCSEELAGRKTAEKGQKLAAEYIANFFKANGLSSFEQMPDSTPFYQDFYLYFWNNGKCEIKINDTTKYKANLYPLAYKTLIDSSAIKLKLAGLFHQPHLENFTDCEYTPVLIINEKKNIILTAHYDHVGQSYKGICVGADDNASGTSVIMELAAKLKQGEQPNCNIVFIAFTAEELGLFGSFYYINNPVVPLDKTIAVINLDMVGRPDKHETNFVHAVFSGPKERIIRRPAKRVAKQIPDFELDLHPGLKERLIYNFASDHFAFTRKKVTNAVFFTDDHDNYHTPTDTPDKINYKNMEAITNYIEKCIYEIDK